MKSAVENLSIKFATATAKYGRAVLIGCCGLSSAFLGCGQTRQYTATEQLLMSDAVDSSIAQIDFRPLAGSSVFLDTQYLTSARSVTGRPNSTLGRQGIVNADYVISSLRQQILAAGCLLAEAREEADVVAEVRIGALGTDSHSVTYGLPSNNLLSAASIVVPGTANLPNLPELSVARREITNGAAKIAVFAYSRETQQAVWQSGLAEARSDAKDTWVFGVGPFQSGNIRKEPEFAGSSLFADVSQLKKPFVKNTEIENSNRNIVDFSDTYLFGNADSNSVELASEFSSSDKENVDAAVVKAVAEITSEQ